MSPGGAVGFLSRTGGLLTSFKVIHGGRSVEYSYSYFGDGKLKTVTRLVDATQVRKATYAYYGDETHGNAGDLKKVEISGWSGGSSHLLATRYYRYYTPANSAPGRITVGFKHGLQFVVGPEAWKRLVAASIPPETATKEQLEEYADYYFQYDDERRVTYEGVDGGARAYGFQYDGKRRPTYPTSGSTRRPKRAPTAARTSSTPTTSSR